MCRWLMFYAVGDSWLRVMNETGYAVIGDLPGIGGAGWAWWAMD